MDPKNERYSLRPKEGFYSAISHTRKVRQGKVERKFMKSVLEMARSGHLPKSHAELIDLHVPRPIGDRASYENTVAIVDALAGHQLNNDQEDYLEILSDLIESYEEENLPSFPRLTVPEIIKHLLEENSMTGEDLAKLLKVDRSEAYKILKGTRNLTTEHIRHLCDRFSVRPDLFI
jgi:antitoxin component HigA of HigAB toxin-antitoxin module